MTTQYGWPRPDVSGSSASVPPVLTRWTAATVLASGVLRAVALTGLGWLLYDIAVGLRGHRGGGSSGFSTLSTAIWGLLPVALVGLTATVLSIVWTYRARIAAERATGPAPRWARGWSVGGWFVPLAGSVLVPVLLTDIWRASGTARRPVPILIWACAAVAGWLLFVGTVVANQNARRTIVEAAWATAVLWTVVALVELIGAGALALAVLRISTALTGSTRPFDRPVPPLGRPLGRSLDRPAAIPGMPHASHREEPADASRPVPGPATSEPAAAVPLSGPQVARATAGARPPVPREVVPTPAPQDRRSTGSSRGFVVGGVVAVVAAVVLVVVLTSVFLASKPPSQRFLTSVPAQVRGSWHGTQGFPGQPQTVLVMDVDGNQPTAGTWRMPEYGCSFDLTLFRSVGDTVEFQATQRTATACRNGLVRLTPDATGLSTFVDSGGGAINTGHLVRY